MSVSPPTIPTFSRSPSISRSPTRLPSPIPSSFSNSEVSHSPSSTTQTSISHSPLFENPLSNSPAEADSENCLSPVPLIFDDLSFEIESPICSPTLSRSSSPDLSMQGVSNISEPLFPGSPVTKGEGWELIMCFAITNRLSFNGITNLLNLFNELCPVPNHLPPSFYLLNQYHSEHKNFKQRLYCSECNEEISRTNNTCKSVECKQKQAEVCEFVEVAFEAHLQQIYEG